MAEIDANGDIVVEYVVDSSPASSTYPLRVEFFVADADGEEGLVSLGSDSYAAANAQGPAVANLGSAGGLGYPAGFHNLVATATDGDGNTSEFSAGVALRIPLLPRSSR